MHDHAQQAVSALGKHVFLRFTRETFDGLTGYLSPNPELEQLAYALFKPVRTSDGTALIVQDLFLPDRSDLARQGPAEVAPTSQFRATVCLIAEQRGASILDLHTHTHPGVPAFSGTDRTGADRDARYVSRRFPAPTTYGLMVLGNDLAGHDAIIYDRWRGAYRKIDWIEVLGRGIEIIHTGESRGKTTESDARYDRQQLIPGWNQLMMSRQRVVILGLGGNGSHVFQTLLAMGVGIEGWIVGVDLDCIEESNLPRIPYAMPEHVGIPKVTVAAQFTGRKNPRVRFYPYSCSATESAVASRIKESTVIICAGDNDGLRKYANEMAVRYQIPLIDLGCDIQTEDGVVLAGGQVRVVLPGHNACLVCCNGFDPATAALELMSDEAKAEQAAHGYVIGHPDQIAPSVANLNATIAQLGVAAFLGLVQGERFGKWDYAHYDQFTAQTITASTSIDEACPLCGNEGVLADGDQQPLVREGGHEVPNIDVKATIVRVARGVVSTCSSKCRKVKTAVNNKRSKKE